ncbi:hypothetical protein RchiOBHm_Chr6g0276131 [Rosa chinensis]|uniref:Uncharacterized protein n=1 Tax=Rosa chinensis TaxID=74649 RepID=A0A2P6PS90_ROSCH|nr:hypothetical protein RchiOBHm_Chr6g0276131 [Rosa chinensis]
MLLSDHPLPPSHAVCLKKDENSSPIWSKLLIENSLLCLLSFAVLRVGKSPVSPPSVVRLHPFVVSFLSLVSALDLFMSLSLSIFHCSCPIVHQISRSTIKSHILLHLKHITLSSSSEFSLFPQPLHFQPLVYRQRPVHLTSHMKIAAVPANHRRLWTSPDQFFVLFLLFFLSLQFRCGE